MSFSAAIFALLLGLTTPLAASTNLAQTADVGIADTSSQNCQTAIKAAMAGVSFGTETASDAGLQDKCYAAVYDPSRVSVVEAVPKQNPKNYKCVGKKVRISIDMTGTSVITASWSAAATVPAGECSTQYCTGISCGAAKPIPGSSSFSDSSPQDGYPVTDTETNRTLLLPPIEPSIAPIDNSLHDRIDDAFTQLDAQRYQTDAQGVPDVTKLNNPNLQKGLDNEAYNTDAIIRYENSPAVSPEIQASQDYQHIVQISNGAQLLTPQQLYDEWSRAGPGSIPEGAALPTPTTVSTFGDYNQGDKYASLPVSENVEDRRLRIFGSLSLGRTAVDAWQSTTDTIQSIRQEVSNTWASISKSLGFKGTAESTSY